MSYRLQGRWWDAQARRLATFAELLPVVQNFRLCRLATDDEPRLALQPPLVRPFYLEAIGPSRSADAGEHRAYLERWRDACLASERDVTSRSS